MSLSPSLCALRRLLSFRTSLASVIALTAIFTSSLTASRIYAASLWSASTTPATTDFADDSAYELGVKFTSDVAGTITAIRFYKGVNNTGTHIGHLWSSTGTLLASATFTNETASGWQQVTLAQPVAITANTVYVASYWDPNGNYALNRPYFTSEYNNAPLHALADGTSGPNGAYNYNSISFPTSSYESSNYWVDVVFVPNSSVSLFGTSATPTTTDYADNNPYELGVRFTSDVSGTVTGILFYKGTGNTGTHIGHLWTNTGTLLASATFTNETASGWQQVNFSQPVAITANTVYVASYWDPNGNYALNRPYFTSEYNNAPLHALADGTSGANGAYNYDSIALPTSDYESSNYWVDIAFTPASTGGSSSASGTMLLSGSPSSLSFGDVTVGSDSTLPFVITNSGSESVVISQAGVSGTGFSVASPTLPLTLTAGQSTSFSVTFAPTTAGSVTGTASVVSNATNSPTQSSLSATGTDQPSVSLSWVASTSTNVSGYDVYRATVSGGPYVQINASLVTGVTYTDTTVQAGETYYYVTTAVNSAGVQSTYSNQASAAVP
jgi:hypothetical protein